MGVSQLEAALCNQKECRKARRTEKSTRIMNARKAPKCDETITHTGAFQIYFIFDDVYMFVGQYMHIWLQYPQRSEESIGSGGTGPDGGQIWELGTKLGSFGRATYTLKRWAPSPASCTHIWKSQALETWEPHKGKASLNCSTSEKKTKILKAARGGKETLYSEDQNTESRRFSLETTQAGS